MRIVTLVENTSIDPMFTAEHGLCIYAETKKHRLLMDTGQTDALIKNAALLDIDLSRVDTVILSHGHYDHSGGMIPFCRVNGNARIIMQKSAALPHYNGERYIGIDRDILSLGQLEEIEGDLRIDDELFVFSGITGRRCYPRGNLKLSVIKDEKRITDDFSHEQCLVITQGDKRWLISGCAHNGILNILDRYYGIFGRMPDYVISGFHMMKREGAYSEEEKAVIVETALELSKMDTVFYSGHCTGIPAFDIMKEIMGDKLNALHSGEIIQ